MKNNKPTLALRSHSIRNLSAAELRIANGGCGPQSSCGCSTSCDGGTSGGRIRLTHR
jgi:hypothetical protein